MHPNKAYIVNYMPGGTQLYLLQLAILGNAPDEYFGKMLLVKDEKVVWSSGNPVSLNPNPRPIVEHVVFTTLPAALEQLKKLHESQLGVCVHELGQTSDEIKRLGNELQNVEEKLKLLHLRQLPTLELLSTMTDPDIVKIAALYLKDKKLLVARNHNRNEFFAVGGKIEKNESELECLGREVDEEIGCKVINAKYFDTYVGMAVDNTRTVKMSCYLVEVEGEPTPRNEVAELLWVGAEDYKTKPLANMLRNYVCPALVREGVL